MIPKTKAELILRIKQDLGEPVIRVNIAKEQLENAVDDAIDYWQQYHNESQERSLLRITLSQENLDTNIIKMPESVFSVLNVFDPRVAMANSGWMSYEFEMTRDAIFDSLKYGIGPSGMSTFVMTKQYLNDVHALLQGKMPFDFRMHRGDLVVFDNLSRLFKAGDYMLVEVMGFLYKNSYNIWGDEALRKLATAYAKKYWGMNLKKFSGVSLPGGTLLNGDAIFNDALLDIEKYENYIFSLREPLGIVIA